MRDAGVIELRADHDESEPLVEGLGAYLREEFHLPVTSLARGGHQAQQQHATDALSAGLARHRDTPDVAVRQQSRGSHDRPARLGRQRMNAERVDRVEFKLERNSLFGDEDFDSDAPRLLPELVPGAEPDFQPPCSLCR
jgi:hypothetical protein